MNDLVNAIALALKNHDLKLTTAESCTGGLIGASLTEIAGSSFWYERGFITYSNLAKQEMLGVPEQMINDFGAVSIEVAEAMAVGALQHSQASIALSVTGIAGPSGGSAEKPVGTVCFAWATGSQVRSVREQFAGDRLAVRDAACQRALHGVIALIAEMKSMS